MHSEEDCFLENDKNRAIFLMIATIMPALFYLERDFKIPQNISMTAITVAAMLFLTDLPSINVYLLNKDEEPQFYGFSSAGIELKDSDKVFFIYEVRDDNGPDLSNAFVYEMYPAECNVLNAFHYSNLKDKDKEYMNT